MGLRGGGGWGRPYAVLVVQLCEEMSGWRTTRGRELTLRLFSSLSTSYALFTWGQSEFAGIRCACGWTHFCERLGGLGFVGFVDGGRETVGMSVEG